MRWLLILTATVGTLGFASRVLAGGGDVCCPHCHHVCQVSQETEKVKHHCWEVECKPICIPRITFPWEPCCEPKCARVKYVNVLKKHEYTCEHCKYKFTPVSTGCGCHEGGSDGACAAAKTGEGQDVAVMQSERRPASPVVQASATAPWWTKGVLPKPFAK